jgi:rubrerythrin
MDQDRYIDGTGRLDLSGIDWNAARCVGLTDDERFVLSYFADIESQTIAYLRDLLRMKDALAPRTMAFLTVWNYEEFFHGRALTRLLAECGDRPGDRRVADVRARARISERVQAFGANLLSRVFRNSFPAVYYCWGAINELTTLQGYEALGAATRNPALAELCRRIAKQERRHFAWYFNSARELLRASPIARRLARTLLRLAWSPVGAGVKADREVARLVRSLFPGSQAASLSATIDRRVDALPGLADLALMTRYLGRLSTAPC